MAGDAAEDAEDAAEDAENPAEDLDVQAWRGLLLAHSRLVRAVEADLRAAAQVPLSWCGPVPEPCSRSSAAAPPENLKILYQNDRWFVPPGTHHGCPARTALLTVSRIAESSIASRACRLSGTTSRSPERPSHTSCPALNRTRPRSTRTVASPGFSCSVSDEPAVSASTVWRSACSWPPYTVSALRPAEAAAACLACSRAMASSENFCMRAV